MQQKSETLRNCDTKYSLDSLSDSLAADRKYIDKFSFIDDEIEINDLIYNNGVRKNSLPDVILHKARIAVIDEYAVTPEIQPRSKGLTNEHNSKSPKVLIENDKTPVIKRNKSVLGLCGRLCSG